MFENQLKEDSNAMNYFDHHSYAVDTFKATTKNQIRLRGLILIIINILTELVTTESSGLVNEEIIRARAVLKL